ncbi:MAG: hypothetical protein KGJ02_02715 [Verrucomicrobiota bacterium]|nr:hypothetical protein [Verrucomicrobiota bacterium]
MIRTQTTDFNPIERSPILRFADKAGYIPVVGTVVGTVRMVVALAVAIFMKLANPFLRCAGVSFANRNYIYTRAKDEAFRGFFELLPFLSLVNDIEDSEIQARDKELNDRCYAFGKYVHQTPNGSCTYSYSKLTLNPEATEIKWTVFPQGLFESAQAIGKVQEKAKEPSHSPAKVLEEPSPALDIQQPDKKDQQPDENDLVEIPITPRPIPIEAY